MLYVLWTSNFLWISHTTFFAVALLLQHCHDGFLCSSLTSVQWVEKFHSLFHYLDLSELSASVLKTTEYVEAIEHSKEQLQSHLCNFYSYITLRVSFDIISLFLCLLRTPS